MGAPGELLGTEKTYAYARALGGASPRVRVFTIGHSEEGREIHYQVGTMVELPRAAIRAGDLAEHAEFFSLGG